MALPCIPDALPSVSVVATVLWVFSVHEGAEFRGITTRES